MKATPAKTLRARPDSQRPPEQQLRPRFYDSPTTRFDGSSASSNSSIDLAPGLILRKKQTRLGQIDSLSTTPNVQPYSQQSKENSDLPRALTENSRPFVRPIRGRFFTCCSIQTSTLPPRS